MSDRRPGPTILYRATLMSIALAGFVLAAGVGARPAGAVAIASAAPSPAQLALASPSGAAELAAFRPERLSEPTVQDDCTNCDPCPTCEPTTHTLTVTVVGSGTVTSNPAGINCGNICDAEYNEPTNVTLSATPASGLRFVGWGGACAGRTGSTCDVRVVGSKSVIARFDILVTTPNDGGPGSLRQAILDANAYPGLTIKIPAGEFRLSGAANEDNAASGDLDVRANMTIVGAGAGSTTVHGNAVDRVFDVHAESVSISDLTIRGGVVNGNGSGIRNAGTLTLERVTIDGNRGDWGGGIYHGGGSLTVRSSTVSGNTATAGGGIALMDVGATLTDVTVRGNVGGIGGGIYNRGGSGMTLQIDNSTISGNSASGSGSGLINLGGATEHLTNVTISGNTTNHVSGGTGVYTYNGSRTTLTNVTIDANGGTAIVSGCVSGTPCGTVEARNTIVANGVCRVDAGATVTSQGNNLDSGDSCPFTAAGDLRNADPKLGPLEANGGPTRTRGLVGGSPALGRGANCPGGDQRGQQRPRDGEGDGLAACDIGAYEVQDPHPADLQISVADSPDPVIVGQDLTYALSVTNASLATAGAVRVTDSVPSGVSFVSATPPCTHAAGLVTCNLGTLAGNAGANLSIVVRPTTRNPALTNSATVSSGVPDPNGSNNTATASTQVDPVTFALSVSTDGAGTVTSEPAGINCRPSCSASFESGGSVRLTANPANGATFGGWGGDCGGATGATCTLAMNANRTVTATFNPVPTFALSVTNNGTGSGTVISSPGGITCGDDCAESYVAGTSVTLTATPGTGSAFAGWGGDCATAGVAATCTVTMSQARSVTATFNTTPPPVAFVLTVSRDGTGAGTVTSTPAGIDCGADCTESYTSDTMVTLTANAAPGAVFVGWSVACSGTGSCMLRMDQARAVTARFDVAQPPAPPGQTPPAQTPPSQTPPSQTPPGQTPPSQTPPGETPPNQAPPGQAPVGGTPPEQPVPDPNPPGQIPPPSLTIDDLSVIEGNSGRRVAAFTVLLSARSSRPVTARFATANPPGPAGARAGLDYVARTGTLTIPPGRLSATIAVSVIGDTAVEPDKRFRVVLSSPIGATLARPGAVGTIVDDDGPRRRLVIGDVYRAEGQAGQANAVFTVLLTRPAADPVSVTYATANGTALAGSDYLLRRGRLTIPANATRATIVVPIRGDRAAEPHEQLKVQLSRPVGAAIADGLGIATILNDD